MSTLSEFAKGAVLLTETVACWIYFARSVYKEVTEGVEGKLAKKCQEREQRVNLLRGRRGHRPSNG